MVSALVLAGGKGKRMKADISKQFIILNGKPILYYTLKRFIDCESIDKIVLVLPKDEVEYCKENILERYNLSVDYIAVGGSERQDSVYNGLEKLKDTDTDIVLIHDGARPFVSEKIIKDGITYAKKYKAAAPGVTPKDTIKVKGADSFSKETLNRSSLVAIQTPQVFNYKMILDCHKKVHDEKIMVTDDTMVVEMYGNKVFLYEGDYNNIKITTPEDILIGEKLSSRLFE